MQAIRLLLNSLSTQWMHGMETVIRELTPWEIILNQSTFETVDLAVKIQPDILIWKVETDISFLDLAELKSRCPTVIPVIIINDPNQLEMSQFIEYGACGCLPDRLRPRQIIQAVELIAIAGISCFPRFVPVKAGRTEIGLADGGHVEGPTGLTAREREILSLMCENHSNQEIAEILSVAESTVKTHLHNIYKKMGKKKRGEVLAAVYSIEEARKNIQSHL